MTEEELQAIEARVEADTKTSVAEAFRSANPRPFEGDNFNIASLRSEFENLLRSARHDGRALIAEVRKWQEEAAFWKQSSEKEQAAKERLQSDYTSIAHELTACQLEVRKLREALTNTKAMLAEYRRDFGDNEDSDSQLMAEKVDAALTEANAALEEPNHE